MRVLSVHFNKKGVDALPSHQKNNLDRERKLHSLWDQLDQGNVEEQSFIKEVSELFINPRFGAIVKQAVQRIEDKRQEPSSSTSNDDYIDEIINESTLAILEK